LVPAFNLIGLNHS